MTELVITVGIGKGTWNAAKEVISKEAWGKIFVVTNAFGKEKFEAPSHAVFIVLDEQQSLVDMIATLKEAFKGKTTDLEVGVNITSGTGKEHTAVLQAIIELGLGFRFV